LFHSDTATPAAMAERNSPMAGARGVNCPAVHRGEQSNCSPTPEGRTVK
jgi:hypothetical protein